MRLDLMGLFARRVTLVEPEAKQAATDIMLSGLVPVKKMDEDGPL